MIQVVNNLNLLQRTGMLLKQKVNSTKIRLLNFKQKPLYQLFAIILMRIFQLQEMQQLREERQLQKQYLKSVHCFLHAGQKLIFFLLIKFIMFTLLCLYTI